MAKDGETQSLAALDYVEDTGASLAETLDRLRAATEQLRQQTQEVVSNFRLTVKKSKWETTNLSEAALVAKKPLKKWCEERSLPTKISFQRFFETFLEEHRKERRCDMTTRSIRLNSAAAVLVGVPTDTSVCFFDLMGHLPELFE